MIVYLSNWLALYPIAFSLLVLLQLSQANTDSRSTSMGILLTRLTLVILFVLAVSSIGLRFTILSVAWLMIASIFCTILYFKHRQLSRSAVSLTMLSCVSEIQVQTAAALFDDEQSGWLGRKLKRFRKLLAQGCDSAVALEIVGFSRSAYEKLTSRLLHRFGNKLQASESLLLPSRVEFEFERLLGRLAMLGWVALVAPVFMFYQVLIVPTLLKMLEEFSIGTPLALSMVSRHGTLGSILGTLVPLMILAVFGATLLVWISPTLAQQPPFRWFCHAYFRSLGWIAFARVSKHTDQPVQALRQTAELVPVGYLSARFEQAAASVESGQSLVDALASAQLMRRQHLTNFASQLDTSGLAWATEQLAAYDVDRMLYRYSIVIQWTLVLITLLFAAFVAMFAIGMLQTLTIMIYEVGATSNANP